MAEPIIRRTPPNFNDLTGQRFGRLVVIERAEGKKWPVRWLCRCDCSETAVVLATLLRNGTTSSCGCLRREVAAKRLATHGEGNGGRLTPEYMAWQAMRGRCECPTNKEYRYYGGRGIRVLWPDFDAFLASMGQHPGPGYSIDRIDNNGPYGPGNCRWATRAEQANNKRSNRLVTVGGITKTMSQWAAEKGIAVGTLHRRLAAGWDAERAVMTPVKR